MAASGLFNTVLCDSFCSNLSAWLEYGKLPFLLWCLHPLTYGCETVAKHALGSLTQLVAMDRRRFQVLFLLLVGGGVGLLLYSIFVSQTVSLGNLACWQMTLLTVLFPLIASL